jgi:molybdate transport system substrate-binding protein
VDVRAVLARVELGEVDAGIVYETDAALAGGRVDRVEIPDAVNAATVYPIARLAGAGDAAAAFVDFVTSEPGRTILAGYGFGPP